VRYYVSLDPSSATSPDSKPVVVDVVELPSGALAVQVDGRSVEVDVVDLRDQLSVRVDGHMVDLTLEGRPPEVGAIANGQRAYVRVVSERERAAEAAKGKGPSQADKWVRSPMPGRIVKVLVEKGAAVQKGQALLVVEAMKMENEVKAKADAVIAEVHVTVGQTVEANAKLLSLTPATQS